ncbi:MAG: cysteine--tRNA ligase [Pseudomonadota bacterium]
MPLVVYNTLTGKKEEFVPLAAPKVGMYVCGITAYDTCHLGHARAAVVFDVITRYLRHKNYDLTYVRNYTDVDDKIINRANKEGMSCTEISERYIKEYEGDMASLGVLKPDKTPKATEHIPDMIATVEKLIANGLAYVTKGGVYYSVRKFKGYGKLSGKNIEELESGARVEIDEAKNDPLDFALWKAAKPGEPSWPSPWGEGRPGWHIECSAMSTKYLGQPFDIHGGGRDLIFPHHENEIAQAEGTCNCQFVRYWLHNGFININTEKMSKSLGNITAIPEVLKQNDAEAVRLFLLSNHYRSPIDYTQQAMAEAAASLDRFYDTADRLQRIHPGKAASDVPDCGEAGVAVKEALEKFDGRFEAAMDDDFNTAMVTGQVFEAVRLVNRYLDEMGSKPTPFVGWVARKFKHVQHTLGEVLGLFGSEASEYAKRTTARAGVSRGVDPQEIEKLIAERKAARSAKDFKRSDAIRAELASKGVEIKDRPDGTTEWKLR